MKDSRLSRLKEQSVMLTAEESSTKKAAPRWMDQSPPEGTWYWLRYVERVSVNSKPTKDTSLAPLMETIVSSSGATTSFGATTSVSPSVAFGQ